jgi:hypothetical protein
MTTAKRNPADTIALRVEFAERFLASPQDHADQIIDGEMQALIDDFDGELCAAKKRWPSLDTDAEWAEMDRWLSEHGYTED